MKIIYLLIILSGLVAFETIAQGTLEDRQNLHDLLDLRRKKFEAYSNSLEKKSGFFGNKTKKDVQHSTDVLVEIVETDNRIISSLNHVVDFRTTAKVNSNYSQLANDERVKNLERANDTLTSQVDAFVISNTALKSKVIRLNWLLYGLLLVVAGLLFSRRRRKSFNS